MGKDKQIVADIYVGIKLRDQTKLTKDRFRREAQMRTPYDYLYEILQNIMHMVKYESDEELRLLYDELVMVKAREPLPIDVSSEFGNDPTWEDLCNRIGVTLLSYVANEEFRFMVDDSQSYRPKKDTAIVIDLDNNTLNVSHKTYSDQVDFYILRFLDREEAVKRQMARILIV